MSKERPFTPFPRSIMTCLGELILDTSEALDLAWQKVLVTRLWSVSVRLWSVSAMGTGLVEVDWWFNPKRSVVTGRLMAHTHFLRGLLSLFCLLNRGKRSFETISGNSIFFVTLVLLQTKTSTDPLETAWSFSLAHSYFWFKQEVAGIQSACTGWGCYPWSEEVS